MEDKNPENKAIILVVDDQPLNRQIFSIIFEKMGRPAIYAEDGLEALEKVKSTDVGVIFMDILMPKMTGCEATENLRRSGFKRPIIAITSIAANDPNDEMELYFKVGMNDLLIKPITRQGVERMLQKWEGKANTPSSAAITIEGPAYLEHSSSAVFNAGEMLATFLNNEELTLSLLARFIERTEKQINNLPDLQKAGDMDSARRDAHTIKSAAYTMGGGELGKAAAHLELAYLNRDKNEIEASYLPLFTAFQSYKKEAEDYLRSRT